MDLDVLAVLSSREAYERYSRFIQPSSLSEIAYSIFQGMGEWFKNNPEANEIDWGGFSAWYSLVRHAKMHKDKLANHRHQIGLLEERHVNEEAIRPLMEGLAKREYASRIGDLALRIADGDYSRELVDIEALLADYRRQIGHLDSHDKHLGSFNAEDLSSVAEPGLEWRLVCMNEALGDLRQGDLLVFGKRPDSGGTTFVASEATYMAEQMQRRPGAVVWLNNEEQGVKVRRRIVQAALGWDSRQMQDMDAAMREYDRLIGLDTIKVFDKARIHIKDAEELFDRFQPSLIVCDQLYKFKGFDQEEASEPTRQTLLFNWGREIAKEYAPVIAVHQAGGEAENRKWIPMDMLYMGKTGPQGEADAIVMMGRTMDSGNTRFLYVPKNKLLTPGKPHLRNGKFEVILKPDHARFEDP